MRVADFHYDLPEEAIAQAAVEPRHASRLLDTRDLTDKAFLDLPSLLQPGDLVVVNETRVRAARLRGRRPETGGEVEFLILERLPDGKWEALARPARRLRPGVIVDLAGVTATIVETRGGGLVVLDIDTDRPEELFETAGTVPLPPYFTGRLADPERYQTRFANRPGSAAAPTAGLHFTEEVLAGLAATGIKIATVDLHVSLDTFRPMTVDQLDDHVMHTEWCSLPEATASAIDQTRTRGGSVVAVGTTVVRTLESRSNGFGGVEPGSGATDLFLRPGSPFNVVDMLVTNFHMPGSTLLVLLEAFMGPGWRDAYRVALDRGYRFLSFGDAMLCGRQLS